MSQCSSGRLFSSTRFVKWNHGGLVLLAVVLVLSGVANGAQAFLSDQPISATEKHELK